MYADFDELFASGRAKSAANKITAVNFIQVHNVVQYDKQASTVMLATARIVAKHGSFNHICQVAPICAPI